MAFVKCSTYKEKQEEQDNRLDALEECCENNNTKNDAQDEEVGALKQVIVELKQKLNQTEAENNEQDERLDNLEQCCNENTEKSEALDAKLSNLDSSLQINENGIGVRISQLENNVLQLKEDGLFMSNNPNDYYTKLYCADHGNDETGDGTREKPFRTIEKALSTVRNIPSQVHLMLYEGSTFDLNSVIHLDLVNLKIHPYGTQIETTHPESIPSNGYYRGYIAANYNRPTIRFRTNIDSYWVKRAAFVANTFVVSGLGFEIFNQAKGDDGTLSGSYTGIFEAIGSNAVFWGCTFEVKSQPQSFSGNGAYRGDVYFRGAKISFYDCVWLKDPTETTTGKYCAFVSSLYTSQVSVVSHHPEKLSTYGDPHYQEYESISANGKWRNYWNKKTMPESIFANNNAVAFNLDISNT